MGVMDLFLPVKPAANAAATTQQTQQQQQGITQTDNATVPNGNAAGDVSNPADRNTSQADLNKAKGESPLDGFKDLFTIDTSKQSVNSDGINFNLDRSQLAESVKLIDIKSAINPELATKALGGDVEAFMQVISDAAHKIVLEGTVANTAILDTALRTTNKQNEKTLQDRFRSFQATENLLQNPQFNHPAIAPIVDSIRTTVQAKNPGASSEEIQRMTSEYFSAFVGHITTHDPQKTTQTDTQENVIAKSQDFSNW